MQLEFDNVNEQFEIHPLLWAPTKVIVRDTVTAIRQGVDTRGWVIYTDASASSYGFGWGYAAFKHGICRMMCNGAFSECSIFMVEAYAVLLAVRYANTINGLRRREIVEIRSDAHGLLKSLERVLHTNGVLCKIKEALRKAYHERRNIILRWVPGHYDIYGNECADLLAKKGVDAKSLTLMPVIDRDIERVLKNRRQFAAESRWENFSSINVKRFLPTFESINQFVRFAPSVALCQLVSGHTRLNDFMCRILGLKMSPLCECGKEKETIEHFLFHCCLYDAYRTTIWEDFQPNFAYVTRDWSKLEEFLKLFGRFRGNIIKHSSETKRKRMRTKKRKPPISW